MNIRLWHASRDEVSARAGQLRALIAVEQECQDGQLIHSDLNPYIDKILGLAEFILLEVDDECQGFCAFYTYDELQDSAFITLIMISPILRSSGLAEQILDHVVEAARSHGFMGVTLWVNRHNDRAIRFYRRLGFQALQSDRNGQVFMRLDLALYNSVCRASDYRVGVID
ncbi:GNAT family N-acetyltransferase [Billgrantia montanilacus]|nr:GNAT family N-acetyltransferase [Halomonas montanilacus]